MTPRSYELQQQPRVASTDYLSTASPVWAAIVEAMSWKP